jgi:L-lactate dehydrogenase complex protein LldE
MSRAVGVMIENRSTMRAALFVTCLADTLFPQVGRATVDLLERLGVEVVFPRAQTCCGQLHLNAGYEAEARVLADRFVRVFAPYEAIVAPSGSCVAHVRVHLPALAAEARGVERRTWELSQFLVEKLGVEDVGSGFSGLVTYHPTCHSLRLLRVGNAPVRLLRAVRGLELSDLPAAEECCGFGGTFAVKNAAVSTAMLDDKLANVLATGADAVCACDASCLMHIGGGLRRRGARVQAAHLAEILAA